MALVSLVGFRPTPRYVPLTTPWTHAEVSESADGGLTWTSLLTVALAPLDADPTAPASRDFTVVNAISSSDLFKVTFTDAEGNSEDSDPVSGAGYPTVDEVQTATTNEALKALSRDEADVLRTSSILAIEAFTGQSFTPSLETVQITTGLPNKIIFLPKRLRTLTAITARGRDIPLGDIAIGPEGDRIELVRQVPSYYDQALDPFYSPWWRSAMTGWRYDFGYGPVDITGDWGWDEVPEGVANALRWDMEEQATADASALNPTIMAYRKLGLREVSQGNLRVQIGARSGLSDVAASPLSDRVQRVLQPYVWLGAMGELV